MSGPIFNFVSPHLAGPYGKAAYHIIGDEQDIVPAQRHGLHLLEIALRRDDRAARSHDRLGEECGDRLGSFRFNEAFERSGHARRELALALAHLVAAEQRGNSAALERRTRVPEACAHVGLPGEAGPRRRCCW